MDNQTNPFADVEQTASNMYGAGLGFILNMAKTVITNEMEQANVKDHRRWTEDMWHAQNAYNSPGSASIRMRQAGLNPFTQTDAQPAGAVGPGAKAQTFPIEDPIQSMLNLAQIKSVFADIANTNADTKRLEAEAEKSRQQALQEAVRTNNFEEYFKLTLQGMRDAHDLSQEQINKLRAEAQKAFLEARMLGDFVDSGGNTFADDSALTQSITRLNDANTEYQNIINGGASDEQRSRIEKNRAEAQRAFADALASAMQTKYIETLNNNATQQEARNAALHTFDLLIKENAASIAASDAQLKALEKKVEELRINGPKDFSEVDDWIWHNLFGPKGALNFSL